MGSSEEEILFQMVRDYIESGSPKPSSSPPLEPPNHPPFSTLQDVLVRVTNAENEILEKIYVYLNELEYLGATKDKKKWIVLRLREDGFEASLCQTSWQATFGRPSVFEFTGDYEYIDVMLKNSCRGIESTRVLVDMDFRSQFEVARPTPTYTQLVNSLPSIFVGTEEKLMKIIPLLSSAAKQSLRKRGLHIPPWRKATYMQSKWLSENCNKIYSFSPAAEAASNPTKWHNK